MSPLQNHSFRFGQHCKGKGGICKNVGCVKQYICIAILQSTQPFYFTFAAIYLIEKIYCLCEQYEVFRLKISNNCEDFTEIIFSRGLSCKVLSHFFYNRRNLLDLGRCCKHMLNSNNK